MLESVWWPYIDPYVTARFRLNKAHGAAALWAHHLERQRNTDAVWDAKLNVSFYIMLC